MGSSREQAIECGAGRLVLVSAMFQRRIIGAFVALLLLPVLLFARDAREQARIEYLLHTVEVTSGVKFIRNGSEYDGAAAAKHLRMKLAYGGERLKTAEDFVKYCATESSMTHQKYKIRLSDGTTMDAAAYFAGKLREFDQDKH